MRIRLMAIIALALLALAPADPALGARSVSWRVEEPAGGMGEAITITAQGGLRILGASVVGWDGPGECVATTLEATCAFSPPARVTVVYGRVAEPCRWRPALAWQSGADEGRVDLAATCLYVPLLAR